MEEVTYIGHSGFSLETDHVTFLFDYDHGDLSQLNREKALVVFVSHKHADHYNPKIFELIHEYPEVLYILSKDVPVKRETEQYEKQGILLQDHILKVGFDSEYRQELSDGSLLEITTLKSTDLGVAFLLKYEGRTYYHAGDLNLWLWKEEGKEYNDKMSRKYFLQLEKLKGMLIDIAFVPLDPRQEEDMFAGIASFMEYTKAKVVFPMHFWGKYQVIPEFIQRYQKYQDRIRIIEREGQKYHEI